MRQTTPEFSLAVACCRWPPSPQRNALISTAATGIDWVTFARVARRHRIEGLVWAALSDSGVVVAEPTATRLRSEAMRITRANLRVAAESNRLARAFRSEGIPLLFVKGLTLGKLAYGGIARKKGWDIDLLVDPPRLWDAAKLLVLLGYEPHTPPTASRESLQTWHSCSKESVWVNPASGVPVELHTSLVNSPQLLPDVGMRSQTVDVEVATGIVLSTLRPDELFAYLSVHGASSGWFRLKWLADIAALAQQDSAEIERLYLKSQQLGAGRAADQALLLAHDLLGMPLLPTLERALRCKWVNRVLVSAAKRLMTGSDPTRELQQRRFGTWAIHWTQFLLLPGASYKWRELKRHLATLTGHNENGLLKPLRLLHLLVRLRRLAGVRRPGGTVRSKPPTGHPQ